MTESQIRGIIEATLGSVEYTPPVDIDYCERVRDDLRKRLPPGAQLDVFHRKQVEFVVEVRTASATCVATLSLV